MQQRAAGASAILRTANLPARRCTRLVSLATNQRKITTLSSRTTHLKPVVMGIMKKTWKENIMIQIATERSSKQAVESHSMPHGPLAILMRAAVICMGVVLSALLASAQSAKDVKGATPLVAIQDEPPVKLVVDPPIPEQLAL